MCEWRSAVSKLGTLTPNPSRGSTRASLQTSAIEAKCFSVSTSLSQLFALLYLLLVALPWLFPADVALFAADVALFSLLCLLCLISFACRSFEFIVSLGVINFFLWPLQDYKQQIPSQELVAKDLHGMEWKFRHIYRGKPRWHLLTTGWSIFVSQKNLVSGDAVLFFRCDDYFQHHILGEVTSLLGFQILQKPKATSSIDHDLRDDVQVPRHSMKEKKVSIHINLRTRGQDREGFGRGATNFHIKRTNAKEAEIRDTPKNLQKYGKSTVFGMHGQFYVSFRNCKLGVEDMQGLYSGGKDCGIAIVSNNKGVNGELLAVQ
ncbi:hypothetical protein JHK85_051685 [Glycine max]|nr:hypothetical protein JHK85_051685 [Glycine max]